MGIGKRVASALSFAHLAGFAKAESDDLDDDKNKSRSEEGDDKKDQDREDVNSKSKSEEDDDKKQREGESDEDYAKRMEESEPEKKDDDKAEGDDDDEEEMRGKSAAASARRRERSRCAAIFASRVAGKNPSLAANLAFNTSLTRKEALAVLESTPVPVSVGSDRAARNPGIAAGGAVQPGSRQAVSAGWDAAFKKVSRR